MPISPGRVELFCLFVACNYAAIVKLQCHQVFLFEYDAACTKLSEQTNSQNLWKGLSDFDDFLHVVICISLDIHWSYKNRLFKVDIDRQMFSDNQIVRCFELKKLENYMRYLVDFWLPLKLHKISCYFGLRPQNTLAN